MNDINDNNVLIVLGGLLPNLAPTSRRIAEAALDDPAAVSQLTISELAQRCQTSPTSVVRLSKQAGFHGYPELRLALARAAAELDIRDVDATPGDIAIGDDIGDIVRKVSAADARAVHETAEAVDLSELEELISILSDDPRTDLYGIGASGLAVTDLYQKMQRIGASAHAWTDPHLALTTAAIRQPGDVVIGFSHSGETDETLRAVRTAKQAGATVACVTNYPKSRLAGLCDITILTAGRETSFRSGAMASRIAQLTMVDIIFVALAQRQMPHSTERIRRTHQALSSSRSLR